ncbi:endonuclease domain-containing protein [Candidatus Margulisiibacteriota bacterium]
MQGKRKKSKYPLILRSRELRKKMTEAESVLWKYLRDRRFFKTKFRRQYVFEQFIIDFYCPECRLAIELDGPIHAKQRDYDKMRQEFIEDADIKVLRFMNWEVFENIKGVLKQIKKHLLLNQKLNPSPSPMEKGIKKIAEL